LVIVIEADQQHLAAAIASADLDHEIAATLADADGCRGLVLLPGLFDCRTALAAVRADMARGTVHHDLGRIGAVAETVTVAALARRGGFQRERVLSRHTVRNSTT